MVCSAQTVCLKWTGNTLKLSTIPYPVLPEAVPAFDAFVTELTEQLRGQFGRGFPMDTFPAEFRHAAHAARAHAEESTGYRLRLEFSWTETESYTTSRSEPSD
jgi:hypothetical protein